MGNVVCVSRVPSNNLRCSLTAGEGRFSWYWEAVEDSGERRSSARTFECWETNSMHQRLLFLFSLCLYFDYYIYILNRTQCLIRSESSYTIQNWKSLHINNFTLYGANTKTFTYTYKCILGTWCWFSQFDVVMPIYKCIIKIRNLSSSFQNSSFERRKV